MTSITRHTDNSTPGLFSQLAVTYRIIPRWVDSYTINFLAHSHVDKNFDLYINEVAHTDQIVTSDEADARSVAVTIAAPGEKDSPLAIQFKHHINPSANELNKGLFVCGNTLIALCPKNGFKYLTYTPENWAESIFRVRIEADGKTFSELLSNGDLGQQERLRGMIANTYLDSVRKRLSYFSMIAGNLKSDLCPHVTMAGRRIDILTTADVKYSKYLEYAGMAALQSIKFLEKKLNYTFANRSYHIIGLDSLPIESFVTPTLAYVRIEDLLGHYTRSTDDDFRRVARRIAFVCACWALDITGSQEDDKAESPSFASSLASLIISDIFDDVLEPVRLAADIVAPVEIYLMPQVTAPALPSGYEFRSDLYVCTTKELPPRVLKKKPTSDRPIFPLFAPRTSHIPSPTQPLYPVHIDIKILNARTIQWTLSARDTHVSIPYNIYNTATKALHYDSNQLAVLDAPTGTFELAKDDGLAENEVLLFHNAYVPLVTVKPYLDLDDLCTLVKAPQIGAFARWQAMQHIWGLWITNVAEAGMENSHIAQCASVLSLLESLIKTSEEPALVARLLTPPRPVTVIYMMRLTKDPASILEAQEAIEYFISTKFKEIIPKAIESWSDKGRLVEINAGAQGRRAKKNSLLRLLSYQLHDDESLGKTFMDHFDRAYIYGDRKLVADMLVARDYETESYLSQLHLYCKGFDNVTLACWLETVAGVGKDATWLRTYLKTSEESQLFEWDSVAYRRFTEGLFRNTRVFHQRDGAGYQLYVDILSPLWQSRANRPFVMSLLDRFACGMHLGDKSQALMVKALSSLIEGGTEESFSNVCEVLDHLRK